MSESLLEALTEGAILAYQRRDPAVSAGLRHLGAAMSLHGIAMNGGLMCGGIENMFFTDDLDEVDDAAEGFRWLGLPDVAALIERARQEYVRVRPTGDEEISDEDATSWDEIDLLFFDIAADERVDAAVAARRDDIGPLP